MDSKTIVLAYSGGLDTSAIIPWLIDEYGAEVIAYCSDLGNAPDEGWLARRAKELGAKEFIFEDLKEELTRDYVFPAVRAGAIYQEAYLLGTALGRPLIAERIAKIAKEKGAWAVAHGCTGKGNDQIRFELAWAYLIPEVKIIAPWKIWNYKGRSDLMGYLKSKGFDAGGASSVYSVDVNLLHRSCEGEILEEIDEEFDPNKIYEWTKPHTHCVSEPTKVSIDFTQGIPTGLDGQELSSAAILAKLNEIGGEHGIGVADLVEERTNGIKCRGIYETPGGTILHYASRVLKHVCWDRNVLDVSSQLGRKYADLVYDGLWHSDARKAIEAYFEEAGKVLTGTIDLKLQNGHIFITGRHAPFSLYGKELVSFEDDEFDLNGASNGFCRTLSFRQWQAGKRNVGIRGKG